MSSTPSRVKKWSKYLEDVFNEKSSFWHHPIRVATVAILDLFKVKYALK